MVLHRAWQRRASSLPLDAQAQLDIVVHEREMEYRARQIGGMHGVVLVPSGLRVALLHVLREVLLPMGRRTLP